MRALRISLIVVVVLAVLAVVADRVALYVTQGEVASRVQDRLGLEKEPDVSINGFPFLTQVLGSELDDVHLGISSYAATVDDQELSIHDLDIELDNVTLTGGFTQATAARAHGEGMISYTELTRAYGELMALSGNGFGVEFEYAGEGQLLLVLQASAMGQTLDIGELAGDLVLEGGKVTLSVDEDEIPDVGSAEMQESARAQLDQERTIAGLPDGLELTSLEPTEEGLKVTVDGENMTVSG
ncbi:DUF2993 domain-containing protein [Streptomyces sp. 3MP-14]|uniref:DUF2993 domain-containing protein n=1 Tax=Streptomyces mimosae TaxID=2586635 RepID=A0A5N6ADU9_9ACTN|nr:MULTISPECIES: DUF2993 domain-containing protein [Streptomyces]KAB8166994.1 DUF2993 domain-containing protein [Streptomyces mimosae]KAB8176935.1 DUF2993 domain-containing protein [Streptomyces sp. 3MP-14]